MKTVVLGSRPVELEKLIQRRRDYGLDTFERSGRGPNTWHPRFAPSTPLDDIVAVSSHPYVERLD